MRSFFCFEPNSLKKYEDAVSKFSGLVLVTGPTGSGKSITLHSSLIRLNKPKIKIITAESPVKFSLEGVNQLQVNEAIGLTFASALRTFLLHSPDDMLKQKAIDEGMITLRESGLHKIREQITSIEEVLKET